MFAYLPRTPLLKSIDFRSELAFFILLSFPARWFLGTDNSNFCGRLGESYQNQMASLRYSDDVMSSFVSRVFRIVNCQAKRIIEHGCRFFKTDSVLLFVAAILRRVPGNSLFMLGHGRFLRLTLFIFPLPHINEVSGNRCRRGHGRADEMRAATPALPSFEVAIAG